jgi:hypothetical protein
MKVYLVRVEMFCDIEEGMTSQTETRGCGNVDVLAAQRFNKLNWEL